MLTDWAGGITRIRTGGGLYRSSEEHIHTYLLTYLLSIGFVIIGLEKGSTNP